MINEKDLENELAFLKKKKVHNADLQDAINKELGLNTKCWDEFNGIYLLQLGRESLIKLLLAIKKLKKRNKIK